VHLFTGTSDSELKELAMTEPALYDCCDTKRVSTKWNTPRPTTGAECRELGAEKAGEPSPAEGLTSLGGVLWHCKAR
jgi:hypothetical protein